MIYREIADRLSLEIQTAMKPGQRLPGVRELAQREQVSLITARNAYLELQERGLIVTRQGSGTFVAGRPAAGPLDLAGIHPPEDLLLWTREHLAAGFEGLSAYDPPDGYQPLRREAARWLARQGVQGEAVITSGSQQALFLTGLTLLKPGDTVAVEDPGYLGVVRVFEALGARVKRFSYPLDLAALQTIADARLIYIMPQAHIPSGGDLAPEVRGALIELALERNSYIIEDDPLSELCGVKPLKAEDRHERVIYLKSLSYLIGPGMRMGFAVFPAELTRRMLELKEINDLSLSGILQRALHQMLASGDFAAHVARLRQELAARQQLASSLGFAASGACLWLATPAAGRLHQASLLKQGLRVTPGDIYGPDWTNFIRVALLTPPAGELKSALERIQADIAAQPGLGLTEF